LGRRDARIAELVTKVTFLNSELREKKVEFRKLEDQLHKLKQVNEDFLALLQSAPAKAKKVSSNENVKGRPKRMTSSDAANTGSSIQSIPDEEQIEQHISSKNPLQNPVQKSRVSTPPAAIPPQGNSNASTNPGRVIEASKFKCAAIGCDCSAQRKYSDFMLCNACADELCQRG
jgi:hypothetical protein